MRRKKAWQVYPEQPELVAAVMARHNLPRLVARILLNRGLAAGDDILAFLYRFHELAPEDSPPVSAIDIENALKAGRIVKLVIRGLVRRKLVKQSADGFALTEEGRGMARSLIRSHRLWEAYLCDKMGFCAGDVHYSAHRLEHVTDQAMQDKLVEESGHPAQDPHQRTIPV